MALYMHHKPYTVNCGMCGGRGGHEVRRGWGTDWEDCPHCRQSEDCYLCGCEINCLDRLPDRLLVDGEAVPVCVTCWSQERDTTEGDPT